MPDFVGWIQWVDATQAARSVSVRPKHLFDLYFDHDYFFKLPDRQSKPGLSIAGIRSLTRSGRKAPIPTVRTELENSKRVGSRAKIELTRRNARHRIRHKYSLCYLWPP